MPYTWSHNEVTTHFWVIWLKDVVLYNWNRQRVCQYFAQTKHTMHQQNPFSKEPARNLDPALYQWRLSFKAISNWSLATSGIIDKRGDKKSTILHFWLKIDQSIQKLNQRKPAFERCDDDERWDDHADFDKINVLNTLLHLSNVDRSSISLPKTTNLHSRNIMLTLYLFNKSKTRRIH